MTFFLHQRCVVKRIETYRSSSLRALNVFISTAWQHGVGCGFNWIVFSRVLFWDLMGPLLFLMLPDVRSGAVQINLFGLNPASSQSLLLCPCLKSAGMNANDCLVVVVRLPDLSFKQSRFSFGYIRAGFGYYSLSQACSSCISPVKYELTFFLPAMEERTVSLFCFTCLFNSLLCELPLK